MRPAESVHISKGDTIGAKYLNDVSARADLATRMLGINGIAIRVEGGRIVVSGEKGLKQPTEPGMFMTVMNEGATDLEVYSAAGLGENFYTSRPNSLTGRILKVQEPKAEHAGEFVVTLQRIPVNHVGLAWFSGVCLVRLVRQFDGPLLNRADCIAGERALRASINGPVRILWEETTDPDGNPLIAEEEHLAVVHWDGRGDTYLDWYNAGVSTINHGCPIVSTGGTGISDNDRLSMTRPSADGTSQIMINVGGDVVKEKDGKLLSGGGPFMARLGGSTTALRSVGILASAPATFAVGSIFWRVLAYLGTNVAGEHWAIIQRDTTPTLLKATAAVAGDSVACEVSTEDEGLSGVELNLPVAWAP